MIDKFEKARIDKRRQEQKDNPNQKPTFSFNKPFALKKQVEPDNQTTSIEARLKAVEDRLKALEKD